MREHLRARAGENAMRDGALLRRARRGGGRWSGGNGRWNAGRTHSAGHKVAVVGEVGELIRARLLLRGGNGSDRVGDDLGGRQPGADGQPGLRPTDGH